MGEKGFFLLFCFFSLSRMQASSKFISQSEHTAKENVFLPKHLSHIEAVSLQSLSDSDTLTCAVPGTELLLLSSHLRTVSGGHNGS